MTLPEARKILGLAADVDPRSHLANLKKAREPLAAKVRTSPNPSLAAHDQQRLTEFDQALAVVQQHLETAEGNKPATVNSTTDKRAPTRAFATTAWLLLFGVASAGLTWVYFQNEQAKTQQQRRLRLESLEKQGSLRVENRCWQEATQTFAEIERLAPGSKLAQHGRQLIESGMIEEQTQFSAYWTGQASAELEAGRFDPAAAAAQKVLEKFPNNPDATRLLQQIAVAQLDFARSLKTAAIPAKILADSLNEPEPKLPPNDATTALEKSTAEPAQAAEPLPQVAAPHDLEVAGPSAKLPSAIRTLHVPGDFATPEEALANARDHDRIVLGAATWKGPLWINTAVELEGAGFAETRVECSPELGSAITLGPDAKGARISGISFRHESFAVGSERFSVALIRGGSATFVDCRFSEASGHGLAVIEGGQAIVSRSRFADNGWDGAAAIGQGSKLEVRDSESLHNFEHGIESWDQATVVLSNNRCEGNHRNGIHVDNGLAPANIEGNQLIANCEFGLVLDHAGSGKIFGNTARANLLGGFVIRATAANIEVARNQATLNQGPGLILEKGLELAPYATNSLTANSGQQILAGTDLNAAPTDTPVPAATEKIPRASIIAEPSTLESHGIQ